MCFLSLGVTPPMFLLTTFYMELPDDKREHNMGRDGRYRQVLSITATCLKLPVFLVLSSGRYRRV